MIETIDELVKDAISKAAKSPEAARAPFHLFEAIDGIEEPLVGDRILQERIGEINGLLTVVGKGRVLIIKPTEVGIGYTLNRPTIPDDTYNNDGESSALTDLYGFSYEDYL